MATRSGWPPTSPARCPCFSDPGRYLALPRRLADVDGGPPRRRGVARHEPWPIRLLVAEVGKQARVAIAARQARKRIAEFPCRANRVPQAGAVVRATIVRTVGVVSMAVASALVERHLPLIRRIAVTRYVVVMWIFHGADDVRVQAGVAPGRHIPAHSRIPVARSDGIPRRQ